MSIATRLFDRGDAYVQKTVMGSLATFGRAVQLSVATVVLGGRDIVRRRFPVRDFVSLTWFMITVTATPTILVSIPFGVIVSVQVGSLTQQVGATSISGAAGGLGVIQQGAPMVAALLLGGAAGAAVAADLGARILREEIDALRTMGIDPIRRLVAPRVAAMLVVGPLICALTIIMGLATGFVVAVTVQGVAPGSYLMSFASFASFTDIAIALGKSMVFAAVVAVVACQRGMETKHGAKAVADSVNASVVIGVVAAFALNLAITQVTTMFFPPRVL
ncbi:ABC transporter permease [Gordonia sp. HY002]|uniref:MlaE family ABC transporter permease n=1 Tax=Gordonia zhenghanii TaxID=2911516 RepID=UPI001EEFCE19|nr:ABC transporter permease [Gordonia zhenghanii]MCF8571693.1 ABC transporter permease [Gordonia zhenghanii]MCF8602716.1 ABC transporter permease [Gordonia zhenghanii]